MANTTIQISERTKSKLFKIINELEKQWAKRVTYDEAIDYLIKKENIPVSKGEFISNIKKFKGILKPGEGQSLLAELRREERERDKKFSS